MTKYSNKRMMPRETSGRFRKPGLERDFGIRTAICTCGAINPYMRAEPVLIGRFIDPMSINRWERPTHCQQCGANLPPESDA